jgi:hypothetical protein
MEVVEDEHGRFLSAPGAGHRRTESAPVAMRGAASHPREGSLIDLLPRLEEGRLPEAGGGEKKHQRRR